MSFHERAVKAANTPFPVIWSSGGVIEKMKTFTHKHTYSSIISISESTKSYYPEERQCSTILSATSRYTLVRLCGSRAGYLAWRI